MIVVDRLKTSITMISRLEVTHHLPYLAQNTVALRNVPLSAPRLGWPRDKRRTRLEMDRAEKISVGRAGTDWVGRRW